MLPTTKLAKTWILWLLIITVAVRLPTMFGFKRSGWDEHAYAFFAHTLDERGIPGIRRLLQDYATDENLRQSPLPLRVGFIVPAMLTCKILGAFNVNNLAWLSFVSGVALVVVGTRFAEQLAGRKIALICAVLLITSPLAAGLSRRAMQDSFTALVAITCLYFFDKCWRRGGVFDHVALGVALSIALLTKESLLLLYPMIAFAAAYYWRAMKIRASPWLLAPLCAAPLIYLLIEAWVCGGIGNLIAAYKTYAALQGALGYTIHYEKGPWFRYLLDFLAIAPLVFIGAVIGLSAPTSSDSTRRGRNLALIYFATGILLFGQLPIINVRLVLFLDVFVRLGATLAIAYLAAQFRGKWSISILYLALGVLVAADAAQFYQIFVAGNLYSPTTFLLLRAEGFYNVQ
jgi:4-amino-4-deoxy-L-arabinose transferase-like glycosyltransferase